MIKIIDDLVTKFHTQYPFKDFSLGYHGGGGLMRDNTYEYSINFNISNTPEPWDDNMINVFKLYSKGLSNNMEYPLFNKRVIINNDIEFKKYIIRKLKSIKLNKLYSDTDSIKYKNILNQFIKQLKPTL